MSKSDIYPREINPEFIDPLLDTYHCDGAYDPQELKGYVPRPKMPHKVRLGLLHILP